MKRRICVVTGTRAEFGLLRWVMEGITEASGLELQVIATGMHLSSAHGETATEILQAGFEIDCRVDMLLASDSRVAVAKSIGIGVVGFADAYQRLNPDVIVVLGDRFEILAAATAALIAGIPIAHIHGGEITEGAFDDSIRHAITKMSHLHFVAAQPYRDRVIQMGEQPDRVFLVGGLGVDAMMHVPLLSREQLESSLGIAFGNSSLLVTFHPVTMADDNLVQMQALLAALDELENTQLIFTLPNADPDGNSLAALVNEYVKERDYAACFPSLGQQRYLSCLQFVDGVVGNSSSGLLEAPSFHVGTVNIGARQRGRLAATSVIHAAAQLDSIRVALSKLGSASFREGLKDATNPYGNGGASAKIVETLLRVDLASLSSKSFHEATGLDDVLLSGEPIGTAG